MSVYVQVLRVVAGWHTGSIPEEVFNGRSEWGWPQWFRFWIFRLSLDILLVLMVALCTIQRDFIHAAYLALTLWLFRRREELRRQGNKLFFWLPASNLCVIILMLVFQAPWQELLDWLPHRAGDYVIQLPSLSASAEHVHTAVHTAISAVHNLWHHVYSEGSDHGITGGGEVGLYSTGGVLGWMGLEVSTEGSTSFFPGAGVHDEEGWWSNSPECSWGHLLGLHRITNAGRWKALELSPHGAGIPLLMWLAIQVRVC